MTFKTLVIAAAFAASGAAFAQATAPAKPMIDTLSNGVTVEHLVVGKGAKPTAADSVKVHYRGTLLSGKEFDSSYKRGQPISFPLGGVIPCWTEGVQKIAVGGKAKVTCPANTAYGARGAGDAVPPNSVLIFEVELLGIGG